MGNDGEYHGVFIYIDIYIYISKMAVYCNGNIMSASVEFDDVPSYKPLYIPG